MSADKEELVADEFPEGPYHIAAAGAYQVEIRAYECKILDERSVIVGRAAGDTKAKAEARGRSFAASLDLRRALYNFWLCERSVFTDPYGHGCQWCTQCRDLAEADVKSALVKAGQELSHQ